jgi:hypothetical protein
MSGTSDMPTPLLSELVGRGFGSRERIRLLAQTVVGRAQRGGIKFEFRRQPRYFKEPLRLVVTLNPLRSLDRHPPPGSEPRRLHEVAAPAHAARRRGRLLGWTNDARIASGHPKPRDNPTAPERLLWPPSRVIIDAGPLVHEGRRSLCSQSARLAYPGGVPGSQGKTGHTSGRGK